MTAITEIFGSPTTQYLKIQSQRMFKPMQGIGGREKKRNRLLENGK
jgi:hypothetical protein